MRSNYLLSITLILKIHRHYHLGSIPSSQLQKKLCGIIDLNMLQMCICLYLWIPMWIVWEDKMEKGKEGKTVETSSSLWPFLLGVVIIRWKWVVKANSMLIAYVTNTKSLQLLLLIYTFLCFLDQGIHGKYSFCLSAARPVTAEPGLGTDGSTS